MQTEVLTSEINNCALFNCVIATGGEPILKVSLGIMSFWRVENVDNAPLSVPMNSCLLLSSILVRVTSGGKLGDFRFFTSKFFSPTDTFGCLKTGKYCGASFFY